MLTGERQAPNTVELALACSCVGSVCFHLGVYDQALLSFQKASLIRTELAMNDVKPGQSVTAEEMAIVSNNMGVCNAALEENVPALDLYEKAYHILREHCGPAHVFTACVIRNIERCNLNHAYHDIPDPKERPAYPIIRRKPVKAKKGKGGGKKKKK